MFFRVKDPKVDPVKSKRWVKIKNPIRPYLTNLVVFLSAVGDANVAKAVMATGVMPMLPYYAGHPQICKKLLKVLVREPFVK